MRVVNTSIDRLMRGLVTRRMRPHIVYSPKDTAIIVVTTAQNVRIGDLPNGVRLSKWARAADITVVSTSRGRLGGNGSTDPNAFRPPDEVALDSFPGLSAFTNPTLATTLADSGFDRAIVVGSRTDIEVDSTARDATELGMHTTVISDCCTGSSPAAHRATVDVTLPRLVHAVLTIAELSELN